MAVLMQDLSHHPAHSAEEKEGFFPLLPSLTLKILSSGHRWEKEQLYFIGYLQLDKFLDFIKSKKNALKINTRYVLYKSGLVSVDYFNGFPVTLVYFFISQTYYLQTYDVTYWCILFTLFYFFLLQNIATSVNVGKLCFPTCWSRIQKSAYNIIGSQ